jgi:hypothetical protein
VGGASITATGNIASATTTVYIDLTSAQIANLVLQAPTTTENGTPDTSIRYLATFGRRLIGASTDSIYWSKLDLPDAFPPENAEPIETGDGSAVTGLCAFSDEILLIFTETSTWGIFGNDPQSWSIRPIDTTLGCVSHLSIAKFAGGVGWWSDKAGPVFFGGSAIERIGLEKLGAEFFTAEIEPSRREWICAGVDPHESRVVWSVASLDEEDRNDKMLPFHFQMGAWESSKWDPIDVAAISAGYVDGEQRLFVGGYEGQLFYFDHSVHNDGIVSGTRSGTFVATASSASSITGTGFYNSNGRLVERKVTVVDSENKPVGRGRIASNNSTTLTLADAIPGLTNGATYTYHIGGPDFRLYTKWLDQDEPFVRKRFDRVYLQGRAEGSPSLLISTHIDFIDSDTASGNEVSVAGDVWDSGVWDAAQWAGSPNIKRRLPIFKASTALRVAVLHFTPDFDIVINKIAVLARLLSDRYYD